MSKPDFFLPLTYKDAQKIMDQDGHPALPRETRNFGQRAADKLTNFCGSWKFIFSMLLYILVWITLNLIAWNFQWDPWPFILLNLTLSFLACLQAPIILMSHNRANQRDRVSQRYDYLVDRHAARNIEKVLTELEAIKKKLENRK